MSLISVIIPTYNHAGFLTAAIESVLAQTLKPSEVIVVVDGSTDDTCSVLLAFEDKVRVVNQKNLGVSAARNNGARVARGSLLAFLDSDDVWLPEKLSHQFQRFQRDPELGLVHCGLQYIDQQGVVIGLETRG